MVMSQSQWLRFCYLGYLDTQDDYEMTEAEVEEYLELCELFLNNAQVD